MSLAGFVAPAVLRSDSTGKNRQLETGTTKSGSAAALQPGQTRSSRIAMPCPTPMHMDAKA